MSSIERAKSFMQRKARLIALTAVPLASLVGIIAPAKATTSQAINLTGTSGQVSTTPAQAILHLDSASNFGSLSDSTADTFSGTLLIGSDNCGASTCTLSGVVNVGGATVDWTLTSPSATGSSPFTYSGSGAPNFSIGGGPGTFSITETTGAMDSLSGSYTLSSLAESGTTPAVDDNMTISGTATITTFSVSGSPTDPFTVALTSAGITGDGTTPLSISVTGCMATSSTGPLFESLTSSTASDSGSPSACVIPNTTIITDPAGSASAVMIGTTTPEPGTFALLGFALAAVGSMAWWRRRAASITTS